jgi:hypothetical protein
MCLTPAAFNGIAPVPGQNGRRVWFAGLIAHHVIEGAAAKRQALG